MRICGIVAEYNPFHNGHLRHINQSRAASKAVYIVVAMSGNFVQRGDVAVCDKFERVRAALFGGADMVIELPVSIAISSAEGFAAGSVALLASTGLVSALSFGSEEGQIAPLQEIAKFLTNETPDFQNKLRNFVKSGKTYPAARALALSAVSPAWGEIVKTPNNILAIEYLKAIERKQWTLEPFTIKRHGAAHDAVDFEENTASAGAIRRFVRNGGDFCALADVMPGDSLEILQNQARRGAINALDNLSPYFHYILSKGAKTPLHRRFQRCAEERYKISEIISMAKTKNITHTAVSRHAVRFLLGLDEGRQFQNPQYIRVLGYRREAKFLLGELHKKAQLPVVVKWADAALLPGDAKKMLEQEQSASKLWWLGLKAAGARERSEFLVVRV